MTRTLKALFVTGALVALPAFAQRSGTKVRTNTNPAGSHTMVMTKSGQGTNRMITKTMTNTEGKKVLTSSRTLTHARIKHGNGALRSQRSRRRRMMRR